MRLIIGNILGLIASFLFIYAGILKKKDKILITQSIQKAFSSVSNIVLKGYSGAIIHAVSIISYLLCYFGKLTVLARILITIVIVSLSVIFNNRGIIGFLPVISSCAYLWFMNIKDIVKFKYLLLFTIVLWCIYDFTIRSYTSFAFGIFSIITTSISVIQIKRDNKSHN